MTREEAIKAINMAQAQIERDYTMDYVAAFDMAIEALKEPPRVHGRWSIHDRVLFYVECSYCHKKVYSKENLIYIYLKLISATTAALVWTGREHHERNTFQRKTS